MDGWLWEVYTHIYFVIRQRLNLFTAAHNYNLRLPASYSLIHFLIEVIALIRPNDHIYEVSQIDEQLLYIVQYSDVTFTPTCLLRYLGFLCEVLVFVTSKSRS